MVYFSFYSKKQKKTKKKKTKTTKTKHQILEIGKRAAQNESFGENVLDEYEFCLSLLNILGERVGEEDWDLVRGLRERFEKMSEAAREGRD